jgi:hypothetical protein
VSIQNVEKQVWLITGQCKAKDSLYRMSMNESGPPHVAIPLASDIRTTVEVENIERLPLFDIHNEQVELLRALYQAQDETGKKIIIDICQLVWFNLDCTSQVFAFLARYYSLQKAVQFVTASSQHFLWLAANTLPALSDILRFDHSFIEDDALDWLYDELSKALEPHKPKGTIEKDRNGRTIHKYSLQESKQLQTFEPVEQVANYICEQVKRIQYLRLRKELRESENFEINQDRDKLFDNLSALGFSEKLTEFLKFAEAEFAKAKDAFDYKTCVDQIRSFFAELLNETAEKIATRRGETLTSVKVDKKHPVEIRGYLERTKFFSEQFRKLADGLYAFMSDEGTHTLGATKDVARIARNIAIEIGLLVTKRLQQPSPM